MPVKRFDPTIQFPLTLIWPDGTRQEFVDIADIECNLEDFDSRGDGRVTDSNGVPIDLRVSMTWIGRFEKDDLAR